MASREKKALAPQTATTKAKQQLSRANNDTSSPQLQISPKSYNKKGGKTNCILETVSELPQSSATGSTSTSGNSNSIAKQTNKSEGTTIATRKKVLTGLKCKKKLRAARGNLVGVKNSKNSPVKNLKNINTNKTTKSTNTNLRIKKTKLTDTTETVVPSSDNNTTNTRGSPKTAAAAAKNLKILADNQLKSAKIVKINRRNIKEEGDLEQNNKYLKSRKSSPLIKNSIDTVIDEVVAMVGDSETGSSNTLDSPPETKVTRSRKMVDDKLLVDYEIKKELMEENDEDMEGEDFDMKETKRRGTQRSLRNGKLRQEQSEAELKKVSRKSETMEDDVYDNAENSSLDDTIEDITLAMSPEPELPEDGFESDNEKITESNNNAGSLGIDGGPTLRSKTKAKSTDVQIKTDDDQIQVLEEKVIDTEKKALSPAKRRSSLNIDVKKTMGAMYGNAAGEANERQIDAMIANIKLTIAKSIEDKIYGVEKGLGVTRAFDNIPRVEEIVVPVIADTPKVLPETSVSEEESSTTNTEQNNVSNHSSNSSDNTDNTDCSDDNGVPKVADTAKEIEKLVMGSEELGVEVNNGETTPSRTADDDTRKIGNPEVSKAGEEDTALINQESVKVEEEANSEPEQQLVKVDALPENSQGEEMEVPSDVVPGGAGVQVEPLQTSEKTLSLAEKPLDKSPEKPESLPVRSEKLPEKSDNSAKEEIRPSEVTDNKLEPTPEEPAAVSIESNIAPNTAPQVNHVNEAGTSNDSIITPSIDTEPAQAPPTVAPVVQSEQTANEKSQKSDENVGTPVEKVPKTAESLQKAPGTSEKPVEPRKRSLRARDKQKKGDKSKAGGVPGIKIKIEPDGERNEAEGSSVVNVNSETQEVVKPEEVGRTRRSRDIKRRREDVMSMQNPIKSKRNRRESKKVEQNKEETLLDNEVAKINENKESYPADKCNKRLQGTDSLRIFSQGERNKENDRSKSENDIESVKQNAESIERLAVPGPSGINQQNNKNLPKDYAIPSTSGLSTNSVPKINETPEDRARKESILLVLGLESAEKAAERRKAQQTEPLPNTGTLKTVIRVPKDTGKEKKRSRSPLKMVLKQGRADGEGDSPEFYTIQKELGTSGAGEGSSGANRKSSTNQRQSCDDETEEQSSKDRQSLIIPEKSSSFSIHPGRLCADVCCYCFGKFGSLDTPMHLAQMKSDERRRKILSIERHLTKDSCLCDACYRHVDRKAHTSPANVAKPPRRHRQLMVPSCSAKDCRDPARHLVKRKWLLKIKVGLQKQLKINWESSQHNSMSFCGRHYVVIERFLTCALCKRRLARSHTHLLSASDTTELNVILPRQGVPINLIACSFACKLCRYFASLYLKYKGVENMSTNHRSFAKSYRKRILHYNDIDTDQEEEEAGTSTAEPQNSVPSTSTPKEKEPPKDKEQSKEKDKGGKSKKSRLSQSKQSNSSKSPESMPTSEKSTPEPPKNDAELAVELPAEIVQNHEQMDLESTVEKLKKRKALDQHLYSTDSPFSEQQQQHQQNTPNVVEILAMDKEEVTLTRLPKKPKLSNDITPVVQRLGANPSISVRTLFPGEEEMGLQANIEFSNVREITAQGWEKCATMIQYDRDTKLLWQELQRPYGNQSSFLRHLILLEKYYRSGDLVLAPNASRNAINYSTSVQNRLISYEGPEKMDEPITEPISEFSSSKRLSGGFVLDRQNSASTSGVLTPLTPAANTSNTPITSTPSKAPSSTPTSKTSPSHLLKMNPGVSLIKKPPPNLQRLNLTSASGAPAANGSAKRKDAIPNKITSNTSGGKVFQMSEPDFKRLQTLKQQKMHNEKLTITPAKGSNQYQKAQIAAQSQFQKHLRMQQEMLSRQSRGDFEPLICDVRSLANENTPAQNLLNNLNLPKSIQVTTKPTNNPIPILPKIPKSLTVIAQTITRTVDK